MSIVPASRLSASDLSRLGNNVRPAGRTPADRRRHRHPAGVPDRSPDVGGPSIGRPDGRAAADAVAALSLS